MVLTAGKHRSSALPDKFTDVIKAASIYIYYFHFYNQQSTFIVGIGPEVKSGFKF